MPVSVIMPQLGESVVEGTISKWFKEEGEKVVRDEPLLEINTDKVNIEVPCPESGTLIKIVVKEGETVDVGTKLGVIAREGEEIAGEEEEKPVESEEDKGEKPSKILEEPTLAAEKVKKEIIR